MFSHSPEGTSMNFPLGKVKVVLFFGFDHRNVTPSSTSPKYPFSMWFCPLKIGKAHKKNKKKIVKKTPHWIPSKHPPPKKHNISPPKKKVTKHPIQHSTLNHLPIFPSETSTTQQLNNYNRRFRPVASLYLIITLSRRFSKTRMWRISGDVSLECILGRFNPSLNDDPKSFWGQPYP